MVLMVSLRAGVISLRSVCLHNITRGTLQELQQPRSVMPGSQTASKSALDPDLLYLPGHLVIR